MSPTSFQTALPRDNNIIRRSISVLMCLVSGGRWIRTTEGSASRFTVCPLWPLGNSPIHIAKSNKADNRTRTDNLLITNQLLCQLSHIGILNNMLYCYICNNGTNRARTYDPLLVRQMLSQLSYDPVGTNIIYNSTFVKYKRPKSDSNRRPPP